MPKALAGSDRRRIDARFKVVIDVPTAEWHEKLFSNERRNGLVSALLQYIGPWFEEKIGEDANDGYQKGAPFKPIFYEAQIDQTQPSSLVR